MLIGFFLGMIVAVSLLLSLWKQRIAVAPEEAAVVMRRGIPNRIIFGDFVLMPFLSDGKGSLQEQTQFSLKIMGCTRKILRRSWPFPLFFDPKDVD